MNIEGTRVLLVNPPIEESQKTGAIGSIIRNLFFNSPPLGIAYIAATLEEGGAAAAILDAAVEKLSIDRAADRILAADPDLLGLTSTTTFFGNSVRLAEKIKRLRPGLPVVIGGPHVSSSAEKVMDHACFDFACIGEGERTMTELLGAVGGGGPVSAVSGIACRGDGKVLFTPPRPLIEDLDTIPMPARHLLPIGLYVPQPNDGPFPPKLSMVSSRGCPYGCIFCDHGTFGATYRSFSPARVVDEMAHLVERYGARDIAFVDSLFMPDLHRVEAIADEIIRRSLDVNWTCTIRANIATPEILGKMKKAGCWRVRIGIEAGSERVLKFIRKKVTREEVRRVAETADRAGLHPKGFFMIGHPTETAADIEESIEFALSLPLTDITVQINTPMPGAAAWAIARDHGEIITDDLERYSFWEPVFVPHGMTPEELRRLYRKFYRSFYLRFSLLARHLRLLRGPADILRFIRALDIFRSLLFKRR